MIYNFFNSLYHLTAEMAPYLLLGFLIAGILKIYVPQRYLSKKLGKPNFSSVFFGALMGVPLPLCSCGVIPTGVSLKKNGASDGATISFLISTPQTGVDSIMITWSMLGWPFAILRPFIAFATGIFGGVISNYLNKSEAKKEEGQKIEYEELEKFPNQKERFFAMIRYAFFDFMDDIAKWLTIGLLLAAAIDVMIPESFIENNLGNPWLEMIFALVLSVPLYICATGSVPLAAVLMLKGLSPGAALVLLMAGPATNAATITVISRVMGMKNLMIYLFAIISGALVFGGLVNYILPANYIVDFIDIGPKAGHVHNSFSYVNLVFTLILTFLILYSFYRKYFSKSKSNNNMEPVFNQYTVIVEGMTCQHCEANVVKNLSAIGNIENLEADKNTNSVTFTAEDPDFSKIEEVINSIGYKYSGKR